MRFETLAVHAGGEPDPGNGAVAPPIHLATTFRHGPAGEREAGYEYQREGNPTQDRLETMLALIEGWVDVVTAQATARLPKSGAIAETVRRRRAAGGPAESAFSTLVGLELRPRRLREAAVMWQKLTTEVGEERRDHLWSHPDLVPTSEDIDDPAALVARLTGPEPAPDDIDQAIEDLLNDDRDDRPHEADDGSAEEAKT